MSGDDQNDRELDALFGSESSDSIPADVERRLRGRLEEFRECVEGSGSIRKLSGAKPSHDRRRIWLAVVGVACAVSVAVFFLNVRRTHAWADVVESVQKKQWIRCHGVHSNGAPMEFWFSSSMEQHVLALRFGDGEFVSFVDFDRGEEFTYRQRDGSIVQRSIQSAGGPDLDLAGSFWSALAPHDELIQQLNEDSRLVDQSRKEVTQDGDNWIQYRFVFEETHGEHERFLDTYLIDIDTDLPKWWIRSSLDGDTALRFEIEYPESGPNDIFELGVPPSTPIIDHTTEEGVSADM